jgi:uncharacterized protein
MYFILFYKTVEDYIEKRAPYREAHLAYANKSYAKGELFIAGALADPADGAVLVFKCDNPDVVEEFAKNDPYFLNGIIKEWNVRKWNVVIGG